ncbi:hypothetical protein C6361_09705 [Plantactinospora sp. BC1]|uniref:hypothetical protein n=1 Tax=Plantactinospora sp. BC1 TaxID=2108470 RepID=UPI000D174C64|nr:hypothetical protein [Plantactinospora sp. BC1]AVT29720.1 hypothetical protein C6361_09705 [Plantactinospora sp. BC1]
MDILGRWKERRIAAVERAAREHDAAEAEAARQRVLEMARRQRDDLGHGNDSDAAQPARASCDQILLLGLQLPQRAGQQC